MGAISRWLLSTQRLRPLLSTQIAPREAPKRPSPARINGVWYVLTLLLFIILPKAFQPGPGRLNAAKPTVSMTNHSPATSGATNPADPHHHVTTPTSVERGTPER